MTRQAFANALSEGKWFRKQHKEHEEALDDNSCASIILQWLSTHENNVAKLINILREMGNQIIKGKFLFTFYCLSFHQSQLHHS